MNWLSIVRYIIARTREPSIVHRGVAAIGGIVAALSITGPAKWVAMVVSGSALVGIFIPDSVQPETPSGFQDRESEPFPPPVVDQKDGPVSQSGADSERVNIAANQLRSVMPAQRPFRRYQSLYDDRTPPNSGWNG